MVAVFSFFAGAAIGVGSLVALVLMWPEPDDE